MGGDAGGEVQGGDEDIRAQFRMLGEREGQRAMKHITRAERVGDRGRGNGDLTAAVLAAPQDRATAVSDRGIANAVIEQEIHDGVMPRHAGRPEVGGTDHDVQMAQQLAGAGLPAPAVK